MIPIKFRAWDKRHKRMIEVTSINFRDRTIEEETRYAVNRKLYLDDVVLMQHTGLKDSKSVEIYEGDVLTLKYPRDRRYTVTAKVIRGSQISAMTLKFEDEFTTEEIPLYKISAEHNLEILGNIYENPELLEV